MHSYNSDMALVEFIMSVNGAISFLERRFSNGVKAPNYMTTRQRT